MPVLPRPKILGQNKVEGGAEGGRWFLLSWLDDKSGKPRQCGTELQTRLSTRRRDIQQRPIAGVSQARDGQEQSADLPAGAPLVAGGNANWTDFVAIVTSRYVMDNAGDPTAPEPDGPVGDFSLAVGQIKKAADPDSLRLWAAVIEHGDWRTHWVAGGEMGDIEMLRVLLNNPDTAPPPPPRGMRPDPQALQKRLEYEVISVKSDKHLGAVVNQLLNPAPLD